jgi:outer membrane protein
MWKIVSRQVAGAALAMGLALALSPAAQAQEAGPKVGYVSIERVLRDSAPAKAAQQKLDSEFKQRQQDLADTAARIKPLYDYLEKNSSIMADSERAQRQKELAEQDKEFQRRQREFDEDVNQRKNEELASVVDRAKKVIYQVADTEHYDVIFTDAVYFNPRVDITDKVIKAINAQPAGSSSPAPAPAPLAK